MAPAWTLTGVGRTATGALLCVLLGACQEARQPDILLRGIPHVYQKPGLGGEACLEMVLGRSGWGLTQEDLFRLVEVDRTSSSGCYADKLDRLLGEIGQAHRLVRRPAKPEAEWRALRADLAAGRPSIVCVRHREQPGAPEVERFRLVIGHSASTREVVLHDPTRRDGGSRRVPLDRFLQRWPVETDGGRQVVRLSVDLRPPEAQLQTPTARLARHVAALQRRLPGVSGSPGGLRPPGAGVSVVAEPPFAVIGDEPAATVRERARTTVRWAATRLKQAYGFRDPREIIDIWLLKDRASYLAASQRLVGRRPDTPFGFYSGARRVMVMNIGLGAGTLVHELVHAFVGASFPGCPPWLNEGLGSLYEACGEREGRIHGFVNWRLPALQHAIRAGRLPPLRRLMSLDAAGFYELDPGTNYARGALPLLLPAGEGAASSFLPRAPRPPRRRRRATEPRAGAGRR